MRGNESYAGLRLQEQIIAVFVQLHQETLHVAIEVLRVETEAVCQVRVVHSAVIARKGDGICFGLFRVDRQRGDVGLGLRRGDGGDGNTALLHVLNTVQNHFEFLRVSTGRETRLPLMKHTSDSLGKLFLFTVTIVYLCLDDR